MPSAYKSSSQPGHGPYAVKRIPRSSESILPLWLRSPTQFADTKLDWLDCDAGAAIGVAIGGLANVSADMVTHTAAITAMRATLVSAWREKDFFVVFFMMLLVVLANFN